MDGGPYQGFIQGTRGEQGLYKAPEVRMEVWVEVHTSILTSGAMYKPHSTLVPRINS